jgi:hypothetical protein
LILSLDRFCDLLSSIFTDSCKAKAFVKIFKVQ